MNITILYFARIKEVVNYSSEQVSLPDEVETIIALKSWLSNRGETWQKLFSGSGVVRAAINHELVDDMATFDEGDEVAFFPPVTGG
ncbi:molybdopterin converting factor subunit 1 [Methylophilus aquaticus]|uniref:Molybdopterin synthase sulfur carrier subunit n=1 Tax=Methylophilus aquaticus TaxID=1971610 RepID=A0ABT9JT11_9PROT|nr:molybdopterin converting factor subunit 1 [Methylophilus aquaticus]MDP8567718.1 molybdopterin converting factor subunit 1 [Methylophilus aquaticus]